MEIMKRFTLWGRINLKLWIFNDSCLFPQVAMQDDDANEEDVEEEGEEEADEDDEVNGRLSLLYEVHPW